MPKLKIKKHGKLKSVLLLLGASILIVILSSVSSLSGSGVSAGLLFILIAVGAMVSVIVSTVYVVKLYKLVSAFVQAPAHAPERVPRAPRQRRKRVVKASPVIVQEVEKGEEEYA